RPIATVKSSVRVFSDSVRDRIGAAMDAGTAERVARVRSFNRFYTRVIGILNDAYLHTRWNVSEARVIFEIATRGDADTAALRHDLGLDSGYFSRILARLEAQGLISRRRSDEDGRRQVISLTKNGGKEFATLNRRSAKDIQNLLGRHAEPVQRRLLSAMDVIKGILASDGMASEVTLRSPLAGEYGWVVERHGAIYSSEYGWDHTFEALVARIVVDYLEDHDPAREAAWIAEVAGAPAGCVFCVRRDDETAQLRLLLAEPHTRGLGVGSTLVNQCIEFARD